MVVGYIYIYIYTCGYNVCVCHVYMSSRMIYNRVTRAPDRKDAHPRQFWVDGYEETPIGRTGTYRYEPFDTNIGKTEHAHPIACPSCLLVMDWRMLHTA
jgi:hypothetical protein